MFSSTIALPGAGMRALYGGDGTIYEGGKASYHDRNWLTGAVRIICTDKQAEGAVRIILADSQPDRGCSQNDVHRQTAKQYTRRCRSDWI